MTERIREVLTHPAALASGVASVLGTFLVVPPDVLFVTAWQSLGTLFGAVSILGFTVGGTIDWFPAWPLQLAAVVIGLLLVVKHLVSFAKQARSNADNP